MERVLIVRSIDDVYRHIHEIDRVAYDPIHGVWVGYSRAAARHVERDLNPQQYVIFDLSNMSVYDRFTALSRFRKYAEISRGII